MRAGVPSVKTDSANFRLSAINNHRLVEPTGTIVVARVKARYGAAGDGTTRAA
jgi:hypothetical protein